MNRLLLTINKVVRFIWGNSKIETNLQLSKTPISETEMKRIFRTRITSLVADGWSIEIENEIDAVLSKSHKKQFHALGWILGTIILFFIFAPLAILNLFIMVVVAIARPTIKVNRKAWIDTFGNFYFDE